MKFVIIFNKDTLLLGVFLIFWRFLQSYTPLPRCLVCKCVKLHDILRFYLS